MTIATLDAVLSGLVAAQPFAKNFPNNSSGRWYTAWDMNGYPGAGAFETTLNGNTYSSTSALVAGQLPHVNPASGNAYLAHLQANFSSSGCHLWLCDRLWSNGGITITSATAQTIASPTWPARDRNGSTNGDGVLLVLEVSATVGAATPTITIGYTNSGGTASRTAVNLDPTISAAVTHQAFRIGLQAGDVGVRSVQSLTLSASWLSGTINLTAYRLLAVLDLVGSGLPNAADAFTAGFPRIYDGTVPFFLLYPQSTIAAALTGHYLEAQG